MPADDKHLNTYFPVLASAARTATVNSADLLNPTGLGVILMLNITAAPNTAGILTVAIQAKDMLSGNLVTIATFTASAAGSASQSPPVTNVYMAVPGVTDADLPAGTSPNVNSAKSVAIPPVYQVKVTHSTADSWTYSITGYGMVSA